MGEWTARRPRPTVWATGTAGVRVPVGAHCSGWLPGWLLHVFRTGTLGAREWPAPGARACLPRPGAAEQTGNCWRGAPNG